MRVGRPQGPRSGRAGGAGTGGASQRDLLRPTPAWNEPAQKLGKEQRVAGAGAARGAKDRPRKERNKAERSEAWREPAQPAREGSRRDVDDPGPYEHKPDGEVHSRRRGGCGGPPEGPPHGWRARAKRGQGGSTGAAGAGRAGITRGLAAAPFKASISAFRASG